MGLHRDINTSENHVLVDFRDINKCPRILLSTAIMEGFFYDSMKNKTSMRFLFLCDFIHPLTDSRDLRWKMKIFLQHLLQYTAEYSDTNTLTYGFTYNEITIF